MDQTPAAMDRHLEIVQCHSDSGILLGASSLTGRYWYGSLWYYQNPEDAPHVEKCTAGVQLEAGLQDACWVHNNKVLVGMDTGGVAIWELTDNLHTFIEQSSSVEHDDIVSSVCIQAGGNKAISASFDRSIKVWDLESFKSINTFVGHTDIIHGIHNHPTQGDTFLTVSQDKSTCLWDLRSPKPVQKLGTSQIAPTCVTWQPGSESTYAVGNEVGQVLVCDSRAPMKNTVSVAPHQRNVTKIQFSSKNTSLLGSVSEDCSLVVTDVTADNVNQIYSNNHKDFVRSLSWQDAGTLYTCGWDSKLKVHSLSNLTSQSPSPSTAMEVNGEQTKSETMDYAKSVKKATLNGGEDLVNGRTEAVTT